MFLLFFLKGLGVKGQQVPFSVSNQAEAAVQVWNKHSNRPRRPKSPVCLAVNHSQTQMSFKSFCLWKWRASNYKKDEVAAQTQITQKIGVNYYYYNFFLLQSSKTQIWWFYSTNFPTFTGHSQSSKHILCSHVLDVILVDGVIAAYCSSFKIKLKKRKEKPEKFFHTILKGNANLSGCCVRPTNSEQQGCDSTLGINHTLLFALYSFLSLALTYTTKTNNPIMMYYPWLGHWKATESKKVLSLRKHIQYVCKIQATHLLPLPWKQTAAVHTQHTLRFHFYSIRTKQWESFCPLCTHL